MASDPKRYINYPLTGTFLFKHQSLRNVNQRFSYSYQWDRLLTLIKLSSNDTWSTNPLEEGMA